MKINEAIKKISGFALILSDEEKEYKFCTTIQYAQNMESEYIFIPLVEQNEDIFELLKTHLELEHCKGFLLNKKILDEPENQNRYHLLMKEFSTKLEVVILVRNVFNAAYDISYENVQKYAPQVISVAGSDEKAVTCDAIAHILSQKGLTLSSVETSGPWQKLFEPLLLLDEKVKHCVVDVDASKNNISKSAADILKNNTVVFTKTSYNHSARYNGAQNYISDVVSVLDNAQSINGVFTFSENDILNENMPQFKNISFIEESKINSSIKTRGLSRESYNLIEYDDVKIETKNFGYYIPRCLTLALKCAMSLYPDDKKLAKSLENYKDKSLNVIEAKLKNNNYVCICTREHTHSSVVNSVKSFCKKYGKFKKVLVVSRILGMSEYHDQIHADITNTIARGGFDTVVMIDMASFVAPYKAIDKTTHIRKISSKNNTLSQRELIDLGLFLKGKIDKNTALLVCTAPSLNLNFLF